ncbi:LegC family aminotransferase [Aureliella helgolandensis]|uniref:Pyridoxal phosphate-dependent aminotransferase EpsN n=1 Tax=Aureliella helgolandensis TaxID=2527968 RepID=A0A518GBZ4_9BACT|nr:LegC family aminotransferase [Aureliella helgolandensis]QDV26141.1 Putative pyridoxal phosphate-dependent aminotransferase EpsN [Aureliella helgolandensis]
MEPIEQKILNAMEQAIGPATEMVLLHRPYLPPSAWEYVKECLDTGWVSSAGSYVTRFEEELAQFTGCRRAVATVNGTAALEVCLRLAGVVPGDEVLCPSLTFVATANAISHCGAVPHFVDVSADRLSICPQALEARLQETVSAEATGPVNRQTGRRIGAVCLMHCFGHPGEIDAIVKLCDEYKLPLIEDAAESLGSYYQGKHTGRFGRLSAISFNGNKILTTGGGGAIVTDDDALADRAKHLTTTAKVPHRWEFHHDAVAWNYRLPNINAALGVAQLEILPKILNAKRQLAERYAAAFASLEGVEHLSEPSDSSSNFWLNALVLSSANSSRRDQVLEVLNGAGYQSRPLWQPMHHLPMYADCPRGELLTTEMLNQRVINIPSSADLAPNWMSTVQ